jgi:hypothetical protein
MPLTLKQKGYLAEAIKAEAEGVAITKGARTADGVFVEAHVRLLERIYDDLPAGLKDTVIEEARVKGLTKKAEVRRARADMLKTQAAQMEAEADEAELEAGS